jgi:hypothetical protein
LQRNTENGVQPFSMKEARDDYGFKAETLSFNLWKTNTTDLEDRLQGKYQHLPLGRRCWRWVAMGDHGFGQVIPAAHQTFIAYSWEVAALIRAGEIVVVS